MTTSDESVADDGGPEIDSQGREAEASVDRFAVM